MVKKAAKTRTRMLIVGKRKSSQAGFTYLMMLAAVVVIGVVAGTATTVTSRVLQGDREAELLFRGIAYQNAIKSYFEAGVKAGRPAQYPRSLEDLVQDPRFATKRHLRRLYRDPFGGEKGEWQLIRAADGGIAGVKSNGAQEPLKKANFPLGLERLQNAGAYSDWVFQFIPSPPGRLGSGAPLPRALPSSFKN